MCDTGTDRYEIDDERRRQRGTCAHNTVTVDDCDSSEVWAGHRVARRAEPMAVELDVAAGRIDAEYRDFRGFVHRRTLVLSAEGLSGTDTVEGKGVHTIAARFHQPLQPCAAVSQCGDCAMRSEECTLAVEFGRICAGRCEVVEKTAALPAKLEWIVR